MVIPSGSPVDRIAWPDGKRFAFTVFDDPDSQTATVGREIYSLLADLGFRTTKGVWPLRGVGPRSDPGECCEDPEYLTLCLELQARGFEIGYHNATQNTADRELTRRALDRFVELFGHNPVAMANHYAAAEGIYWGDRRLSGPWRAIYNLATRRSNVGRFFGEVDDHPLFWGDLCRERIAYVRNFVFPEINTLRACPIMPYFDPKRPYVRSWYSSSEGSNRDRFVATLAEANQDRLADEGGACIMYTHFGHGYVSNGRLDRRFIELMTRLARMDGWFAPVSDVLGHIRGNRPPHVITAAERSRLERRWLLAKLRNGTS